MLARVYMYYDEGKIWHSVCTRPFLLLSKGLGMRLYFNVLLTYVLEYGDMISFQICCCSLKIMRTMPTQVVIVMSIPPPPNTSIRTYWVCSYKLTSIPPLLEFLGSSFKGERASHITLHLMIESKSLDSSTRLVLDLKGHPPLSFSDSDPPAYIPT